MRTNKRKAGQKTGTAKYTQAAESRSGNPLKKRKKGQAGDSGQREYTQYHLSAREYVQYGLIYMMLDLCISYLFFYSWIAFVVLLPGSFFFLSQQKKELQKKKVREIQTQFLNGIQLMSASLQAGYSAENALKEATGELRKAWKKDAEVVSEFEWMVSQIEIGRNLEELFLDFARRSGSEDILSFAEVFLTAKRSGGDLLLIIRNTTSCIRQKQETMQEIETTLSGKVMEQNIMSLIPLLILAYVKVTSPEFLDGMYGNLTGTAVMSICLAVYGAAYFWGRKIVQIEV